MKVCCVLLLSCLLATLSTVLGDLKLMHPLPSGGMLLHDVSYDAPDYHYIPGSPLGGVLASDIGDSYLPAASLGVTCSERGLSAFPAPLYNAGIVGGLGGIVGGVRSYPLIISGRRRFGKRIKLFRI